eukprot:GHVU01225524.1.p2 GENE.GHVU01225524.1~~GHVU01225524.1.p2  ORF type:complete len:224 (+),score=23.87 GHVU01225524.1:628-1299(+)
MGDRRWPFPSLLVSCADCVSAAISGVNFPRGEGTCTRRPCVLRLENDRNAKDPYALVSEKAEMEDAERVQILDVERKLKDCNRKCDKTISDEPIHVKVVRSFGPSLTLIDVPGITHDCEAQKYIAEVIVGMIKKYISNEEMITLAVVPAIDDFGNAQALKLARDYDPDGLRTVGVVTKIDEVPHYSEVDKKILMERDSDIYLEQGWIAVRCRSPKEVKEEISH